MTINWTRSVFLLIIALSAYIHQNWNSTAIRRLKLKNVDRAYVLENRLKEQPSRLRATVWTGANTNNTHRHETKHVEQSEDLSLSNYTLPRYWSTAENDPGLVDFYKTKRVPNINLVAEIFSHPATFEYFDGEGIVRMQRVCIKKINESMLNSTNDTVKITTLDLKGMPASMQIDFHMRVGGTRVDFDHLRAISTKKNTFFESVFLIFLRSGMGGDSTYDESTTFHGIQLALLYLEIAMRLPERLWNNGMQFFYLGWEDFKGSITHRIVQDVHEGQNDIVPPPLEKGFCMDNLWLPTNDVNQVVFKDTPSYQKKGDAKINVRSKYGKMIDKGLQGLLLERTCGYRIEEIQLRSTQIGLIMRDSFPLSRHLVNSAKLLSELDREKISYKVYFLEELSICEQIRAIGSSSVLVGPHGAGLFAWTHRLFSKIPVVNLSPRPCRAHPKDYFHVIPVGDQWERNKVVAASLTEGTWAEITKYWSSINPTFAEKGFTEMVSGWSAPTCEWMMQEIRQGIMAWLAIEGDDQNKRVHINSENKVFGKKQKYIMAGKHNGMPTNFLDNTFYKEASASYFWTDIPMAMKAIKEADPFITKIPVRNPDLCYFDGKPLPPKWNYPTLERDCHKRYWTGNEFDPGWENIVEEAKIKYGVGTFEKKTAEGEGYVFSIKNYTKRS